MNLAIGLLGYLLLIVFAATIDWRLGIAAAAVVCLYISYANSVPPRKGTQ
jgi:hypothetical protein